MSEHPQQTQTMVSLTSSLPHFLTRPHLLTGQSRRPRGQASLEMTVALGGALLLLFASVKVCLWFGERVVRRQLAYEQTRVSAGGEGVPGVWVDPTTLQEQALLRVFDE